MQGKIPGTMDMEATMEITCTEGNAVSVVAVFGQHLRQKMTKIHKKEKKVACSVIYNDVWLAS